MMADSDLDEHESPMLNVQSIQTQTISSPLLPTHTSTTFAKKPTLAFSLNGGRNLDKLSSKHLAYFPTFFLFLKRDFRRHISTIIETYLLVIYLSKVQMVSCLPSRYHVEGDGTRRQRIGR
jgi:hypothetical protein